MRKSHPDLMTPSSRRKTALGKLDRRCLCVRLPSCVTCRAHEARSPLCITCYAQCSGKALAIPPPCVALVLFVSRVSADVTEQRLPEQNATEPVTGTTGPGAGATPPHDSPHLEESCTARSRALVGRGVACAQVQSGRSATWHTYWTPSLPPRESQHRIALHSQQHMHYPPLISPPSMVLYPCDAECNLRKHCLEMSQSPKPLPRPPRSARARALQLAARRPSARAQSCWGPPGP